MKKLYLLSAAALMAFAANAQDFQGLIPDGNGVVAENVTEDGAACLKITPPAEATNQWDAQVITPSWVGQDGQAEGAEFCLSFDYKGTTPADASNLRIASGKTYPWDANYNQGANTQITDDLGTPVVYAENQPVTTDWITYAYDYYIGAEGADSIRLEIDCGAAGGAIFFKNFELKIEGNSVWTAYAAGTTPGTAISEAASVNAFVANNVLYASEASDIVVYNINGVAVLSAKASSLDLNSLKAGLYVAKVNGAAVKFVK